MPSIRRSMGYAAFCLVLAAATSGCASCPPCAKSAERCAEPPPAPSAESPSGAAEPSASPAPAAPQASAVESPAPAPAAPTPAAPAAAASADSPQSLPEVEVQNVGLHIGGGPNDDATKAPFLKAIEGHFDAFRACYVKVEEPEKGGTFGVDLHIGRNGGKATVKQPRTGMKGNEFRECVLRVFEGIEFDKPKKGATVISYSIRYGLKK